jgi:hypothetical protein
MPALYINQQTEAEKDTYLFDCFHDSGIIGNLVDSNYTILSGRKGMGKSAIARYLEKNAENYGVDFVFRLSIRNFNIKRLDTEKNTLDSILYYIIVKAVQKMLNVNYFSDEAVNYWKDFLLNNGLQQIADYESFVTTKKARKTGFSIKAAASYLFAKGEGGTKLDLEDEKSRAEIADSPASLYDSLRQSINPDSSVIIFIDDISDYLDESDREVLKKDLAIIKSLLLNLQAYNLNFIEEDLKLRFISLVRDDIFEYMEGSNINKLKTDSLKIEWSEKDFSSLLIRRMPYFADNLEEALSDPVKSIKERFPDDIFTDFLKSFSTNRYGSNFYAYMAAISFNRPRDFLQFCYALRNRLSVRHPASSENIEAAEIEYSNYFIQELRDELYVASRVFDYDFTSERIDQLIDILSKKDAFNSSQLKADLSSLLGTKTSVGNKKIELLLSELWRYGVIGVSEKAVKPVKPQKMPTPEKVDKVILFKYLSDTAVFTSDKIKEYTFYLHRGLWWFAKTHRKK